MRVVVVSLGAKNIHKGLGAWCLKAYCDFYGEGGVEVIESNVNCGVGETVGLIYEARPDVVAFSCYIWNADYVVKAGSLIKKLLPDAVVILGGPEVSYEENFDAFPFADFIVRGAGEEAFFALVRSLRRGILPVDKIVDGTNCGFKGYPTPFTDAYFDSFEKNRIPIGNQLVYFEASRGCPFSCAYCLSSASDGVQYLDFGRIRDDLLRLIGKGARCIKFVDRTFNANKKRAVEILEFIGSLDTDCTFHFEVAADLFDDTALSVIEKMPRSRVQFEIGIQSVNGQTLTAVSRRTDTALALENIRRLTGFSNCHIHVDLIAGLPHETIGSFAEGVDRCIAAAPDMLQLGFLKMLKGTRMRREYSEFGAVFEPFPPYKVYRTDTLSYDDILELERVESVIDKFYNSGAFESTVRYAVTKLFTSPYGFFKRLADFCPDITALKLSMKNAYTLLLNFLTQYGDRAEVEHHIKLDCLSVDSQGLMPDSIKPLRNKDAEAAYRKEDGNKRAAVRIEFFPFTATHILFDYDNKNRLKNKFESREFAVLP